MTTEQIHTADVVIVGAGPSGLTAALSACRNGASSVVLLESRTGDRSRNNVLLLDAGIVAGLEHLGVEVDAFTPATDFTFIDADAGQLYQFPLNTELRPAGHSSVWAMFPRRTPCADILTSELETALLKAVEQQAAIRLLRGAQVTQILEDAPRLTVDFEHDGLRQSLTTSLLAVCDGARSRTLDLLGIPRSGNKRQEVAMVANFRQPGKGQIKFERADRSEEVLALCSNQGTTITIRMPLDTRIEDHSDREQRIKFMRHKARKIGVDGEFITEPRVVEISHDRARQCARGYRIFVLGDAARTATPRLGLGVNWAIRDAIRFGNALPLLRSRFVISRQLASLQYRLRTRVATQVLLFQGWLLDRSDRRSRARPLSGKARFKQKSFLMRFTWRAGKGSAGSYDPLHPLSSIEACRRNA